MDIQEKVLNLAISATGRQVTPATAFEDMGLDSLETLDFFCEVEKAIGELPHDALIALPTLGDVIRYLEAKH